MAVYSDISFHLTRMPRYPYPVHFVTCQDTKNKNPGQ